LLISEQANVSERDISAMPLGGENKLINNMRFNLAFYQTATLQHIAIKCELQRAHRPITVLHDNLPNRRRD